jgi:hypothetical protein
MEPSGTSLQARSCRQPLPQAPGDGFIGAASGEAGRSRGCCDPNVRANGPRVRHRRTCDLRVKGPRVPCEFGKTACICRNPKTCDLRL